MIEDLSKYPRRELEARFIRMAWNEKMGCHTRKGMEEWVWDEIHMDVRWLVYLDVDGVHQINQDAGNYDRFDGIIKQVWGAIRSTDVVAGQWNSGDEFFICIKESEGRKVTELTAEGLVDRLTKELARHGLTAIFAVSPVLSPVLHENISPLSEQVLAAKKARGVTR